MIIIKKNDERRDGQLMPTGRPLVNEVSLWAGGVRLVRSVPATLRFESIPVLL